MGASLSWLVCDVKHKEEFEKLLSATECKQGESPSFCINLTPQDKMFIFEARGRRWNFDTLSERERLSLGKEVYYGVYEEHVMFSEGSFWRNGTEIWKVTHDSDKGVFHLKAQGDIPEGFIEIKNSLIQKQNESGGEDADVDHIIGIPTALMAKFTGCDCSRNEPNGEYFEWVSKKPCGFLSKIFGWK